MLDFRKFEVLTFDCYGTLIDWESGILRAVRKVLRNHQLEFDDPTAGPLDAVAEFLAAGSRVRSLGAGPTVSVVPRAEGSR